MISVRHAACGAVVTWEEREPVVDSAVTNALAKVGMHYRSAVLVDDYVGIDLQGTGISSLAALTNEVVRRAIGGREVSINIAGTSVRDFSPLSGLSVRHLNLSFMGRISLRSLSGVSVRSLALVSTEVDDVAPAAHVPLGEIAFNPFTVTNGLQQLMRVPSLARVNNMAAEVFWKRLPVMQQEVQNHSAKRTGQP